MRGLLLAAMLAASPVVQAAEVIEVSQVDPYWRPVELTWGGFMGSRLIADGVPIKGDQRALVAWQQALLEPVGGLGPSWTISQTKRWIGWAIIGSSVIVALVTWPLVGPAPAAIVLGVGLVTVSVPPYASDSTDRYEAWRQTEAGWAHARSLAVSAETHRWRSLGLDAHLIDVAGVATLLASDAPLYDDLLGGRPKQRIEAMEEREEETRLTPTLAWVLVYDPSTDVRHRAWRVVRARANSGIGDAAAHRGLVLWTAAHGTRSAREEAVGWLGKHTDEPAFLAPLLDHPQAEVRIPAIASLANQARRTGTEEEAASLLETRLAIETDEDVKRKLTRTLRRLE